MDKEISSEFAKTANFISSAVKNHLYSAEAIKAQTTGELINSKITIIFLNYASFTVSFVNLRFMRFIQR